MLISDISFYSENPDINATFEISFACGEPFYGTPGRGKNEIRIAYTINAPDIKRSMEILKIALEKYNNR